MLSTDRDAVECDLAESYGIFDLQGLPVGKLATLVCGLRENSRIRVKLSEMNATPEMLMYATMVDRLTLLAWLNSCDGAKGTNRPKSMLEAIMGAKEKRAEMVFASGKDFEEYRKQFEERINDGRENDRQGICPDTPDNTGDRGQNVKPAKTGGGKGRRRRRRKRRR